MDMKDLPVVCTLGPETGATRKAELLPALVRRVETFEPTENGYRFRFAASTETLQAVVTMIEAERQCCRFLRFQLTVEPDEGPIWLTLEGPPGTREFLDALISTT